MPAVGSTLYDDAVLWPVEGFDRFGQSLLGTPVPVKCRWDDTIKQATDAQGNRVSIDAMALMDRDVVVGSEMWLGALSDWIGTGSGQDDLTQVMEVKTFNETNDVRGRYSTKDAGLCRKAATRNPQVT